MNFDRLLGIAGFILSAVAIPLSLFLGKRDRNRPLIGYSSHSTILAESYLDGTEKLVIKYGKARIRRVVRTLVAFWNERGNTIRRADIVESDPPRICLSRGDGALHARVLYCSRLQNDLSVTLNPVTNEAVIDFDFLDPEDGAILEIFHQDDQAVEVKGTLRGARTQDLGSMDLSEQALLTHTDKSITRRFSRGVRRISLLIFAVFALFVSLIQLCYDLDPKIAGRQEPRLVNTSSYDLNTLSGQRRFKDDVNRQGIYTPSDPLWITAIQPPSYLILLGLSILVLFSQNRTRIPRNILSARPEDGNSAR